MEAEFIKYPPTKILQLKNAFWREKKKRHEAEKQLG